MKAKYNIFKMSKISVLFLLGMLLIQCGKNNINQDIVLLNLPTNKDASPETNEIKFNRKETYVINSSTELLEHHSNHNFIQRLHYKLHGHLSHVIFNKR